jgi:DNA-binding transcriptional LysR family regulator
MSVSRRASVERAEFYILTALLRCAPCGAAQRQELPLQRAVESERVPVVRDAAVEGLGTALLPRFMAAGHVRRRRLVEGLRGWTGPAMPVHAIFASSRYLAPKVRAFLDLARASTLGL